MFCINSCQPAVVIANQRRHIMSALDPSTGRPLPSDAIQRVLYITSKVHVYAIPPLTSNKGHTAALWTRQPPIFTARLRVLETARPTPAVDKKPAGENVQVAILLEDGSSGELFAAAPYSQAATVEQAVDSSRFFAVRVVGEGGMKATLGVGFEERSDAFDFGITLQDAGKVLGFARAGGAQSAAEKSRAQGVQAPKKDYSLKEGQTITVNIGSHSRRSIEQHSTEPSTTGSLFAIKPPPSAQEIKQGMQGREPPDDTTISTEGKTAEELGFDDGEFGEFQ